MAEVLPGPAVVGADQGLDLDREYGSSSLNVDSRFQVYRYAIDGKPPFHDSVVQALDLAGDETILDAGFGSGSILMKIRQERQHQGQLIGIDINERLVFSALTRASKRGLPPIDFRVGDALDTGLEDNSVDVVLALFMLYVVESPEQALEEFYRVLKPGGLLVASTSGVLNKTRHREFERWNAEHLGTRTPKVFSHDCDDKRLAEILPKRFGDIKHIPQQTFMQIPEGGVDDLMSSLTSMWNAADTRAALWYHGLLTHILPEIEADIDSVGFFEDIIDRHQFWASKPA